MRYNSRSIYGATQSEYPAPLDGRYTQKGNRLYLHIFNWPFRHIHLDGLAGKIEYAQFLHDASEVKIIEHQEATDHVIAAVRKGSVALELPVVKPNVIVPVVEIFLKD